MMFNYTNQRQKVKGVDDSIGADKSGGAMEATGKAESAGGNNWRRLLPMMMGGLSGAGGGLAGIGTGALTSYLMNKMMKKKSGAM